MNWMSWMNWMNWMIWFELSEFDSIQWFEFNSNQFNSFNSFEFNSNQFNSFNSFEFNWMSWIELIWTSALRLLALREWLFTLYLYSCHRPSVWGSYLWQLKFKKLKLQRKNLSRDIGKFVTWYWQICHVIFW